MNESMRILAQQCAALVRDSDLTGAVVLFRAQAMSLRVPMTNCESWHDMAVVMAMGGHVHDALGLLKRIPAQSPAIDSPLLNSRWLEARLEALGTSDSPATPVYGFMHIATMDRWRQIVQEQVDKAQKSGLLDLLDKWFVTIAGPESTSWVPPNPKMKVVDAKSRLDDGELTVLRFMRSFCERQDCHLFYVHTKGVSHRPGPVDDWRRYMEYFVIERHADCRRHLTTCDVAGVNWHTVPWPHFSGNFWWATSRYIRTLPPVDLLSPIVDLDFGRRYLCERWIGENAGVIAACLHESGLDHYHLAYPPEHYISQQSAVLEAQVVHARAVPSKTRITEVPTRRMPAVTGFVHVAMINHWRDALDEQITKMHASGLWDEFDRLVISCVGPCDPGLQFDDPRVSVVRHDTPLQGGERPTLQLLQEDARHHPDCAYFFVHTMDGIGSGSRQDDSRRVMEHFILLRFADCLQQLTDHDVCGINWENSAQCRRYPGNHWWARSDYLRTLPDLHLLDADRKSEDSGHPFHERWIGENPDVRAANLFQTNREGAGQDLRRSSYSRLCEVLIDDGFKPSAWAGLENRFQDLLEPLDDIRLVVEIGVEWGFSLFCLAKALPYSTVIGIDPYESVPPQETRRLMSLDAKGVQGTAESRRWVQEQIKRYRNAILLRITHEAASRQFSGGIDVLHLDAVHQYDDVRRMFHDWEPHIRPGGCVLMHDTLAFPEDVGRFFGELPGRKAHLRVGCGLGAWYKPRAHSPIDHSGAC